MKWSEIAFDWNHVRAFLATVEEGSLSAAARQLKQTQATISRQVAGLEQDLGTMLFLRTGRKLVLTPAGGELLEHVRAMADAANKVSLSIASHSRTLQGRVVITVTDGVAANILPRILKKIRLTAPLLQLDIRETVELVDMAGREADIAIRHSCLTHKDFVSNHIGDIDAYLCASQEYLTSLGSVQQLSDLSQANFIGIGRIDQMIEWLSNYDLHLVPENFAVNVQSGVVQRKLVQEGIGIAVMPQSDLSDNEIRAVLPNQFSISVPIWLSAHRNLLARRSVKFVYEILAEDLGHYFRTLSD